MKLNLECGTDVILGYRNIDSQPQKQLANVVEQGDFTKLGVLGIPDSSVEEIRALHVLQLLPLSEIINTINHWRSKMKSGGELYLQNTDSEILGNMMAYNSIGIDEANITIFGTNKLHRSLLSLAVLESVCEKCGFIVKEKGILGHQFFMRVVKI